MKRKGCHFWLSEGRGKGWKQEGNETRIEGEEGKNREGTGQNAPKRSEGKIEVQKSASRILRYPFSFRIFAGGNETTKQKHKDMPYRRLPNTDAARLRALKTALDKSEATGIGQIAFSLGLKQKIEFFLPKFEMAIKNSVMAKEQQFGNSPKFSEYAKKARLYVSHFIQVLNFCIARGEMKPAMRAYYGLDVKSSKVPPLMTEQDLLQWGEKIINGEQERLRNRDGNPIYCPSIALVKVNYENFKENYLRQKQYQSNSARESGNVAQFRTEADNLILELWNEVEEHFASLADEEERRRRCEAYGLVYVFRRGEEERIRQRKEVERITLKLF